METRLGAERRIQKAPGAFLRLTFPCDIAEVRPTILAARAFLSEHTVVQEDVGACELALAEACNNAVQYATEMGRRQPVVLTLALDATSIEARVEDHSPGFAWPRILDVPDPRRESGRGLFLIQSLMDEATYLQGPDSNCLVLRRRRRVAKADLEGTPVSLAGLQRRREEDERVIHDMAEELSSCYESLSAIFRYGAEQGGTGSLQDFANRLLGDLLRITDAGWYVLRLVTAAAENLEVFTASEPALYLDPLPLFSATADADSIELQAVVRRRDTWFDQPGALRARDPLRQVKPTSVGLVHPVYFGETLIGTLTLGGTAADLAFTAAKVNVIHTFADFLAIQLVNRRYQDERLNGLLMARELDIARHIQRSLLVKMLPEVPGVGLAGYCESARQVGGDYFDVIKVSESGLLVLVSDVMGKGIPAAMFAVILRSLVRACRELAPQPSALLAQVNRLLFEELSSVEMFITAQLTYVDVAARRLVVANAGHCPMLVSTPATPEPQWVAPEGIPLGVLEDPEFAEDSLALEPQLRALLYTDGLTELSNPEGEVFGQKRLLEWLRRSTLGGDSAARMKDALLHETRQFRGDQPLPDDQTFVIISS